MGGQQLLAVENTRVGSRWGVGYRAIFRTEVQIDPIEVAERHVREWLGEKLGGVSRLDDWDGASSREFNRQFSIATVDANDPASDTLRRLYRLTDSNAGGNFAVALYAARPGGGRKGLLVIEAARERVSSDVAIDAVGTPRLVRDLIEELHPRDGNTALTSAPQFIRGDDLESVIDAITDDTRIGSVIVASSPGTDVDAAWVETVTKLTRNSVGVAAAFVVAGSAVDDFNALLPTSHQTPPGSVRTYAAGVLLDDPTDSRVHRFLGPSTLARSIHGKSVDARLAAVHARGPRLRLLERGLPVDARRTIDLLDRAERRQRLAGEVATEVDTSTDVGSSLPAQPSPEGNAQESLDPSAPLLAAIGRIFARWLGRDDFGASGIEKLDSLIATRVTEAKVALGYVEEVEAVNERLLTELAALRQQLDDRDFDIALSADELRLSDRENQKLRSRLRELHEYHVPPDDQPEKWAPPADVEELIARMTPGTDAHAALELVEFTGDPDAVSELRKRDPYGKYANDLWDYVRVLFEYAEMRKSGAFNGSVYMYLEKDEVNGFKCSPQRHAAKESDSVLQNTKWRNERVLPVPSAVDPDGRILMEAHFRPTHRDQFAPRMYYFDDIAGSGKIYIGYIGRHLSNTKTS